MMSLICFAIMSCLFVILNSYVTTPYMVKKLNASTLQLTTIARSHKDEIFHVPQTQAYCAGRFSEWNDKITTFPGLYFAGLSLAQVAGLFGALLPQSIASSVLDCNVHVLRFVNIIFAVALFAVLLRINNKQSTASSSGLLKSIADFLCPVMFFYHFLFYTDTGGTLFVMLAYYYSLLDKPLHSALFATVAVLFRQTNIIWAAFVAITMILKDAEQYRRQISGKDSSLASASEVQVVIVYVWRNFARVALRFAAFLILAAAFVIFLVLNNGSIVVGDKSNHVAAKHFAMCFYFAVFAAAHLIVTLLGAWRRVTPRFPLLTIFLMCTTTLLVAYVMQYYSAPHAFTLADNRHYMFYLWRRVLDRNGVSSRVMLAPLFACAMLGCWQCVRARRTTLWALTLCACALPTLVLTPLLEPRYFTIPLLFLRLEAPQISNRFVIIDFVLFSLVNLITLGVFVFRPFIVDEHGDMYVARFMW